MDKFSLLLELFCSGELGGSRYLVFNGIPCFPWFVLPEGVSGGVKDLTFTMYII